MSRKRSIIVALISALAISLSLWGCADDTTRRAKSSGSGSAEFRDWSANEQQEMVDSITQSYNRQVRSHNKVITDQLKRQDADIELMNERYSYGGQNITGEGFIRSGR